MNRYPIWKYAILAITLAFGLIYTLPNFFGESPAVQVSSEEPTNGAFHQDWARQRLNTATSRSWHGTPSARITATPTAWC